MKISFAICCHNETSYLNNLTMRLQEFLEKPHVDDYEIIIVDDNSDDEGMRSLLALLELGDEVKVYTHSLAGDFAAHKNFMNSQCTGDWILNLDADEHLSSDLLEFLPMLIEQNPDVEAYWLPRVNIVQGLTLKHLQKWHWTIVALPGFTTAEMLDPQTEAYSLLKQFDLIKQEDPSGLVMYDQPIVAWPDPQMRLYKNDPKIKWEGKVHERLVGFDNYSMLPFEPEYAIRHYKTIARQEAQNNFYETIQR